jgi:hypothetical protein
VAEVKIKLNSPGVRQLLQSAEIMADLVRRGEAIAAAAGEGFEVRTSTSPTRARVTVRTATFAARRAEAVGRALTRALDAGR